MYAHRRLVAASMLLVCLAALAGRFVPRRAAASGCCGDAQSCCCRRDAKSAWRAVPSCGERCGCAAGKFIAAALPIAAAPARGVAVLERGEATAEPRQTRSLSSEYLAFLYQLPPPAGPKSRAG